MVSAQKVMTHLRFLYFLPIYRGTKDQLQTEDTKDLADIYV